MSFLPEGYEVPSAQNGYMKLVPGVNKFRIISEEPLLGYEWWIEKSEDDGSVVRKPVRIRMGERIPPEFADTVRHFWAMVVWNYTTNSLQILEITQKTIMRELEALARNPKWGAPSTYDIVITRIGDTKESTTYSVMPDPKEDMSMEMKKAMDEIYPEINLEALLSGADPFAGFDSSNV